MEKTHVSYEKNPAWYGCCSCYRWSCFCLFRRRPPDHEYGEAGADLIGYRPTFTRVFARYQDLTANLGDGSVSRGLPTFAELEAYSVGAGLDGLPAEA